MKHRHPSALLIPAKGPVQTVELDGTLEQLQTIVGGLIQALPVPEFICADDGATAYVNEEGKFDPSCEPNMRATDFLVPGVGLFWGDYVAGPMLVCGFDPRTGRHVPLPAAVEQRVRHRARGRPMTSEIPPTLRGYDAREVVSALQKAIRRSDPDAALYWAFELARSGFGPWLWKRLRVICTEDCSPEALGLVADVKALNDQWQAASKRSDGHEILFVARAVISLATAPKNRVVDWAVWHHNNDHVPRREIPDEAYDRHTLRGRRMGRDREHFIDEASRLEPWRGSLDVLEAEYREVARRRIAKDPSLPHNPWGDSPGAGSASAGTTEPAHNPQLGPSGQLQLHRDEEDR